MDSYFYFFIRLLSAFFLFYVKMRVSYDYGYNYLVNPQTLNDAWRTFLTADKS